ANVAAKWLNRRRARASPAAAWSWSIAANHSQSEARCALLCLSMAALTCLSVFLSHRSCEARMSWMSRRIGLVLLGSLASVELARVGIGLRGRVREVHGERLRRADQRVRPQPLARESVAATGLLDGLLHDGPHVLRRETLVERLLPLAAGVAAG